MIQVPVAGIRHFERAEADVVESFVVDAIGLVGVLDQLVDGQGRVVRLHHRVRHFGRRHHRVRVHYSIRVLLPDLGDEQRAHAGPSAAAEGMSQLETLQAVAVLAFLPHHVQHRVDQLRPLRVVPLRPIVPSPRLAEHEIVGAEYMAERAGPYRVHGAWLQIDEDSARYVFPA